MGASTLPGTCGGRVVDVTRWVYRYLMAPRDQVYQITNAQVALSVDQSARTKRYLWSMAIRTFCFLGAVFTDGWLRWVLVVGAVALPYLAVVVANAGRERTKDVALPTVIAQYQPELPASPTRVATSDRSDGESS